MRKHRKLLAETLRSRRIQLVFGLVSVGGFLLLFHHQTATNEFEYSHEKLDNPIYYAVFCSSTPNGQSYRGFDYAYNLPLTALAWERIGFRSIVQIIGSRCEWEKDPALSLVLAHLDARHATVIFLNAPLGHRMLLSQTARLFAVNMKEFPGRPHDHLVTSDADLWPLRKAHFLPRPDKNVVLLHSECCEPFMMKNKTYPMYPMSNIGATVSTWRQIMNHGRSFANESESILNYLEDSFGEKARRTSIITGQEEWYMDQRIVSIRLSEWITKYGNSSVYRVSDNGFYRLDRLSWNADKLAPESFKLRFDAHLPEKGFLPVQWKRIQPLLTLMYGKNSWQARWCDNYTKEFLIKVTNYLEFGQIKAE